jgi:hypothetical protein
MGLSFGLAPSSFNPKTKNRWMFSLPGVIADKNSVTTLPPKKASRPGISLKEGEFQHVQETIYYPMKAEWKVISLTLYDIRCNNNAVFDWLEQIYTSEIDLAGSGVANFGRILDFNLLKDAKLELYTGCGEVMETWTFQGCYPSNIEWGDLDMESADIVTVDVTLRYQRAFFSKN